MTTSDAYHRPPYRISTRQEELQPEVIHGTLTASYWARGIPRALVEKSLHNSLCFGVYEGDTQVGFARVVTDYATFGYLCDVFILDSHQGRGLGKWLMECVMAHPELQGLRRWTLVTADAHGLYTPHGFQAPAHPERHMEILVPDAYGAGEK